MDDRLLALVNVFLHTVNLELTICPDLILLLGLNFVNSAIFGKLE